MNEKRANDFLSATGTEFIAEKVGHGLYFPDDTECRDIYNVTLKRQNRVYSFKFGQSVYDSELPAFKLSEISLVKEKELIGRGYVKAGERLIHPGKSLDAYAVLAAVTKHDPGSFEAFCADYGYNIDSRTALDTYLAGQQEYENIYRMFSACMEKLREIE